MKGLLLRGVGCLLAGLLPSAYGTRGQAMPKAQQAPLVAIEALGDSYSSCEVVNVRVRNASHERISVEAYVEDLKDDSWTATWCQYSLLDPGGRLVKRFRPKVIEPQGIITVRYDRCSDYVVCVRPKFPNTASRELRQLLEQEDARTTANVRQRIRVDAYVRSGASLKEVGEFWSQPFARGPQGREALHRLYSDDHEWKAFLSRVASGERRALEAAGHLRTVSDADTPTFVLLAEDAPVVAAFEMSAVLGNTIGLRDVRYFVFSRKTNVMGEITLGAERWRLSFDGKLVKSNQ